MSHSLHTPALIVCGPSTKMKSRLIRQLITEYGSIFAPCTSYTTRTKRSYEVEGIDYYFVSRETMEADIAKGKFLEHTEVAGNWYGVSKDTIQKIHNSNQVPVFDVEGNGALTLKKLIPVAVTSALIPLNVETMKFDALLRRSADVNNVETDSDTHHREKNSERVMKFVHDNLQFFDFSISYDKSTTTQSAFNVFRNELANLYPQLQKEITKRNSAKMAKTGPENRSFSIRVSKPPLIIVGPSCEAKTKVLEQFLREYASSFEMSLSSTSRTIRAGEKDGVDYQFLTHDQMESEIRDGAFIEYSEHSGRWFGSRLSSLLDIDLKGKVCVFDVDTEGAATLKQVIENVVVVALVPSTIEAMKQSLKGKSTDSISVMHTREHTGERIWKYICSHDSLFDIVITTDSQELAATYSLFVDSLAKKYSQLGKEATKE